MPAWKRLPAVAGFLAARVKPLKAESGAWSYAMELKACRDKADEEKAAARLKAATGIEAVAAC